MQGLLLNNRKVTEQISIFLKREFRKRNKTKAVLGISGGIDSTVAAILCKKTGLDLYAVILPYKKRGLKEAEKIAQILNLPNDRLIIIDITSPVNAQIKEFPEMVKLDKIDKGNIMVRQRMIILYALARSLNGLVVGTENLSEYYLGYFTLHGDQACDINPLGGLFKTQIYNLAKYLRVPKMVLEKAPTAGFWLGQTDEKEFDFSYEEADPILYLYCVKKFSKEKIIKKGFSQNLVNKVLERVKATEYKRQTPPEILFTK